MSGIVMVAELNDMMWDFRIQPRCPRCTQRAVLSETSDGKTTVACACGFAIELALCNRDVAALVIEAVQQK